MNKIFIEAESEKTSECNFLKSLLSKYLPSKDVCFVCMAGVDNLFTEPILNQIRQASVEGDNVVVILDSDTQEKGYGFKVRLKDICDKKLSNKVDFHLFLYPDNASDGDVEVLMEKMAKKDFHQKWWDCFSDYETCIAGIKDEFGHPQYVLPNRKARLHTYISSQRLSNSKRKHLGTGNWLFDDTNYWDLNHSAVMPLVDFLRDSLR